MSTYNVPLWLYLVGIFISAICGGKMGWDTRKDYDRWRAERDRSGR